MNIHNLTLALCDLLAYLATDEGMGILAYMVMPLFTIALLMHSCYSKKEAEGCNLEALHRSIYKSK